MILTTKTNKIDTLSLGKKKPTSTKTTHKSINATVVAEWITGVAFAQQYINVLWHHRLPFLLTQRPQAL